MCKNNTTTSVLEYNKDTQSVSAYMGFSVTAPEAKGRPVKAAQIYGAFQKVIIAALKARLEACTMNVIKCKDNITAITEYDIVYLKHGIARHYSFNAANAMRSAIAKAEKQEYSFDIAEIVQLLKALAWVDKKEDQQGIPFQVLMDALFEEVCLHIQCNNCQDQLKAMEKDMAGTEQVLSAVRADNEKLLMENVELRKKLENIQKAMA